MLHRFLVGQGRGAMARRPMDLLMLASHLTLARALTAQPRSLLPSRPVPSTIDKQTSEAAGVLTPQAMVDMTRVGASTVSPDGSLAAFEVREYDSVAKKFDAQLWLADLSAAATMADGALAAHEHLTLLMSGKQRDFSSANTPQFSPCGEFIAFLSDRGDHSAVWLLPTRRPGEARLLKSFAVPVSDLSWTLNGLLTVSASVYVDEAADGAIGEAAMIATAARDKALQDDEALGGLNAVLLKRLPMREWDRWLDGKMRHPFAFRAVACSSQGYRVAEEPAIDLISAVPTAVPSGASGGSEDWSISTNGWVAVSCRPPLADDEAWTTNRHIYLQRELPKADAMAVCSAADLSVALGECLTYENPGYDTNPAFSPTGTRLAWLTMAGATYEADAVGIQIYDVTSKITKPLLRAGIDWDYSPDNLHWSADGLRLYFNAQIHARRVICYINVDAPPAAGGEVHVCVEQGSSSLHAECKPGGGGRSLLYSSQSLSAPPELFLSSEDGSTRQLTHFNREKLRCLELGRVGEFTFAGASGEDVQAWLVRPAGFSEADEAAAAGEERRLPLAVVIHGGPQAAVCDEWNYRWNLQAYAAAGFATLAVNFHGSTGFGHEFARSISGDWELGVADVVSGTRCAIERYPWIDATRVVGLGGSFGGFAVNWLNGNAPEGMFKALVCHCGTFDAPSSYWATDE